MPSGDWKPSRRRDGVLDVGNVSGCRRPHAVNTAVRGMLLSPTSTARMIEQEGDMASLMDHPPFGRAAKMRFLQALNKVIDRLEEDRKVGNPDRIRVLEEQEKVLRWQLNKACNPDPEAVAAWHERAIPIGPPPHAR